MQSKTVSSKENAICFVAIITIFALSVCMSVCDHRGNMIESGSFRLQCKQQTILFGEVEKVSLFFVFCQMTTLNCLVSPDFDRATKYRLSHHSLFMWTMHVQIVYSNNMHPISQQIDKYFSVEINGFGVFIFLIWFYCFNLKFFFG